MGNDEGVLMQANREDLAVLLQLQQVDMDIVRVTKELAELPQRKVIVSVREKKHAIEQKREKVAALKKEAESKLSRVSDEDEMLAEKQRAAQKAIDEARGDYRNVEARTKEMNGFAKRRATLEADLDKLGTELDKIKEIEAQVASALATLDHQEAEATASFRQVGGALKNDEARLQAQRAHLAEALPEDLLKTYEKTASRTGGVAVARLLEGGKCGACRAPLEGGRLVELKAQAPLGVCPSCRRLLIVV